MKTIKGIITSSKPISLVKAASVLHKFINEDTEASKMVSEYLERTSASFDEHVQFHNELKGRSRHKHKKIRMETVEFGALADSVEEQGFKNRRKPKGGDFDDEGMNSQRKRKKDFSDFGLEAKVREGKAGVWIVEEKRDKTKKRKKEEAEDGELNDSEERHIRKNKKSKRINKSVSEQFILELFWVLMLVEQEQKVTEDARRFAEQDAATQRYAVTSFRTSHHMILKSYLEM
ncbi:hypothetical protein NE237_032930 [Protea cynaroides]|uniref:Uncharacterized protein n=1 Tax=Protea cynaroides TaxID=273540 RepID=A0A9Q0R3J2_9MAGN|nr:hypothetical protein NE237_032930 [Protea cynaroides]